MQIFAVLLIARKKTLNFKDKVHNFQEVFVVTYS